MIPHIIHYCWYGGSIASNFIASKCVKTFKRAGNVELMEWNDSNCPCNENIFIQKCRKSRKYAFISDYYRLKALYEFGGIYCDTDLEVKKPLPDYFF